jgi:hypothetical protein
MATLSYTVWHPDRPARTKMRDAIVAHPQLFTPLTQCLTSALALVGGWRGLWRRHHAHHGLSPTRVTYTALTGESTAWLLS